MKLLEEIAKAVIGILIMFCIFAGVAIVTSWLTEHPIW